jgi:exodeoxyribonuclease VII large subunit
VARAGQQRATAIGGGRAR